MATKILSEFEFDDMLVRYLIDSDTQTVELGILPKSMKELIAADKMPTSSKYLLDSLVHVKCVGDVCPIGFSLGLSLRNSESTKSLQYDKQQVSTRNGATTVKTRLISKAGFACEHILRHYKGEKCLEVYTVFRNESHKQISLEMLTSFSLGKLNAFQDGDGAEKLNVHRMRSYWSAEGRHECVLAEDLHLETSWSEHSVSCERFGQVGTMPVRQFFPFIAIEDIEKEVFWAAQLAYAGSWQIEVYKKSGCLEISGGLADREFGHWLKNVEPGQYFETPKAYLTVARGCLDEVCYRLVKFQQRSLYRQSPVDKDMPIIFNEYCTTWGSPSQEKIIKIADRIKGSHVKYLVIDAGWYVEEGKSWASNHGDWIVNPEKFPDGLKKLSRDVFKRGMILGIWFEMETVGYASRAFAADEHFLTRDGITITVGGRKFWDFRDSYTRNYLKERLVSLIKESEIGYLKVDYNETIGIGVDGSESLGEGARQHVESVKHFFEEMRELLPDLVIENCSSGGHRLEPSMMALADMGSFSDAHETVEIPVVAANLHRLILPRQSQVWSVLKPSDSIQRIYYSMAAGFLGRLCISGDICGLSKQQYDVCLEGQEFYKKTAHIINDGISHRFGDEIKSYRHPKGWQAVLRVTPGMSQALAVVHNFAKPFDHKVEIKLPDGVWSIKGIYGQSKNSIDIGNFGLLCSFDCEFTGSVVHLAKKQ